MKSEKKKYQFKNFVKVKKQQLKIEDEIVKKNINFKNDLKQYKQQPKEYEPNLID